MPRLSPEGQRVAEELSQRHGFSVDAVEHMLLSMLGGNGSMAQFSHHEFGGYGQWMRGGMLMLGDMFNNSLKARVDALCTDIANLLATQPEMLRSGSFQSQSQSGSGGHQHQHAGAAASGSSYFTPDPFSNWWPAELGSPSASGAQNNVRYAYFADQRRLAVDSGGDVWVYDTQDHQIGGFSQQQGSSGSITFSSQFGPVHLNTLRVVSRNGRTVDAATAYPTTQGPSASPGSGSTTAMHHGSGSGPGGATAGNDVFAAIERLGDLRAKGVLTDEEFAAKKAELLARL